MAGRAEVRVGPYSPSFGLPWHFWAMEARENCVGELSLLPQNQHSLQDAIVVRIDDTSMSLARRYLCRPSIISQLAIRDRAAVQTQWNTVEVSIHIIEIRCAIKKTTHFALQIPALLKSVMREIRGKVSDWPKSAFSRS